MMEYSDEKNYTLNPEEFTPKHQASACIIEHEGKIILLKRNIKRSPSGLWGIPAGKIDEGESPEEALLRELKEEIGFEVSDFEKVGVFKVRLELKEYDFVYHLFKTNILKNIDIILSDEHEDYIWVNREEALELDLEHGAEIYLNLV